MTPQVSRRSLLAAMLPKASRVLSLRRFDLAHQDQALRLWRYLRTANERQIILEAIVASHLPQLLCIGSGASSGATPLDADVRAERLLLKAEMPSLAPFSLFELRRWEGRERPAFDSLLREYGLAPVFSASTADGFIRLIPFESIATRAASWTSLAVDREWLALRHELHSSGGGMALYRCVTKLS
jgi:hypothetical protein